MKKITMTLSHKIKIRPLENDFKTLNYVLRDLQLEIQQIQNATILEYWSYDANSAITKHYLNQKINIKDIDPNSNNLLTHVNRANKLKFQNVNGEVLEQSSREAIAKYNFNKEKMKRNEGFIPSFGSNPPIPIKNSAFELLNENDNYILNVRRLFHKDYAKALHKGIKYTYISNGEKKIIQYSRDVDSIGMKFKLIVKKRDRRTIDILNKCASGEYKQGTSKLYRKVNGDWYFILTYTFESEKEARLNKDNIMGIDMGVKNPVYIAFNNSNKYYKIEGDEIRNFRNRIVARRNSLLKQSKYCGEGRIGHGRKTRIKPVEKLRDRVENFKATTNHKYSKWIVDMAIKHNCGTIQMEDLSKIADGEKKASYLGDWTYYDLQQKIEYKAKQNGIEVVKIKPNYTSARCSKCGHIHRSKTKDVWRPSQEQFICQNCDYGSKYFVHADRNAAINIATKGIEKIIKYQLEKQEKEMKHAMKYEV